MARLATYVYVNDEAGVSRAYGPDDELPDWVAHKIMNPLAWDESPEQEPEVRDIFAQAPDHDEQVERWLAAETDYNNQVTERLEAEKAAATEAPAADEKPAPTAKTTARRTRAKKPADTASE